jgi:hypothetical protein
MLSAPATSPATPDSCMVRRSVLAAPTPAEGRCQSHNNQLAQTTAACCCPRSEGNGFSELSLHGHQSEGLIGDDDLAAALLLVRQQRDQAAHCC